MSTEPTAPYSAALLALLERFNLSPEGFAGLRADAYEQQLASHSLEHLEQLYTELLKPGQTLEAAQQRCPPWPPRTPRAGALPSLGALSKIAERLRTEQTLNSLGRVSQFMEKLRTRATALPIGQQTDVLDALITMTGEELLQAKLGGQPVSANLDPLDRLLARQEQKRKEADSELSRRKFQRETVELFLKWHADQEAQEILRGNASNADKTERLGRKLFGDLWK